MIARNVVVEGGNADRVASGIVDGLRAPDLRCAFVFADWRLDPAILAHHLQRGLAPAPVVGGTTTGVVPFAGGRGPMAIGLGLYGDWLRVGIGVGTELSQSPLTRSRDAVLAAAVELGTTRDALDVGRHVGLTIVDGRCGSEESFCIGSAATAPQIRFVGGCASTDLEHASTTYVWARGEALTDAGIVILLQSELPCSVVTSSHVVPTELKTVVTAASGRTLIELDGYPAARRLADLVAQLGETLDRPRPWHALARHVDGTLHVRSIMDVGDEHLALASAVEVGQVLRIMRPGDLIGQTKHDLAIAAERVGGAMSAFLAFSCLGRHSEASARGLERELADVYAAYPTTGFQTFGEQSGMLLVNHSLRGLAIGSVR
ncbi:MAG: hypothetical protein H6Q90_3432 [Deltaproteobacteria bacterium]|nr:hypothetical protein [Deltaproteobacteria bacterium]